MKNKLYVGNLPWSVTEDQLTQDFAEFGEVVETKIIFDRETNRSKGFGFVTYATSESATNAVTNLDGAQYGGRNLKVSIAEDKPRAARPARSFDRGGDTHAGNRGNRY